MTFELQRVQYMPKNLEPGILYVSDEFGAAAHLCACGCGSKVRTPISPTDWRCEEDDSGPSLYPSVGNWQQPCQSHYWIRNGRVLWADKWSADQIAVGRAQEEAQTRKYYDSLEHRRGVLARIWHWLMGLFGR